MRNPHAGRSTTQTHASSIGFQCWADPGEAHSTRRHDDTSPADRTCCWWTIQQIHRRTVPSVNVTHPLEQSPHGLKATPGNRRPFRRYRFWYVFIPNRADAPSSSASPCRLSAPAPVVAVLVAVSPGRRHSDPSAADNCTSQFDPTNPR